ncbi:MAG: glycosyltransferase family 4 protein [Rudaea sp.]
MKILAALQYYLPNRTGYTLHVQRVAEALAARGHRVDVLTARHRAELAPSETIGGVRVSRLWAPLRVSRGAVMPGYPWHAFRAAGDADVVWISTPLLETALWAFVSRLRGKRLVVTHHGDLHLPPGAFNRFVEAFTFANYRVAARAADALVAYSDDYARHSTWLRPYAAKVRVVHPPIAIPRPDPEAAARCRAALAPGGGPVVAYAGRFVQEKRPDVLLRAAMLLRARYPGLCVAFAGERQLRYEDTFARCRALLEEAGDLVAFVGLIEDPQALADFYAACDVLALPSDTECFALVQVEAMLCGTPVVASDIPGGRVPVVETAMGRLFRAGDPRALAEALDEVLRNRSRFVKQRERVDAAFSLTRTVDAYEAIFAGVDDAAPRLDARTA